MTDSGDIARMKRIAERIRARGVRVVFVDGWDQRGETFPVVPDASFVHHDASNSRSGTWGALGIITNGRAGVPPPLSQFQVARGTTSQVAIVAAGIANHAGLGGPHKGLPKDNANRETYGMEVANDGVGEKYTNATIHTIRVVQASVAEECDFGPDKVIGHKEWTDRKIDPTYDMGWMRNLVAETMEGDDMANFTDKHARTLDMLDRIFNPEDWSTDKEEIGYVRKQINQAAANTANIPNDVWHTDGMIPNPFKNPNNPKWTAGRAIYHLLISNIAMEKAIETLAEKVASDDTVTPDELKEAIRSAFAEAFKEEASNDA